MQARAYKITSDNPYRQAAGISIRLCPRKLLPFGSRTMKPQSKETARTHRGKSPDALRRRAEARLKKQPSAASSQPSEVENQRLLHELQVHQVELELQYEELQKLQAEAETAAARYTDLYDFAPVGYFTLDREGVIARANLAGASLLGCERGRLTDRRFGAFVAEADRAAFNTLLQQVFLGEAAPVCDLRLVNDGQPPRVVHLTSKLAPARTECYVVAVDVTERRQMEDLARQWQQMFQSAEFSLWRTDPVTNTFVAANAACATKLGYACEEMVGKKVLDIYPPEFHAEIRQRMQVVDYVGHLVFESIHLRKDGTRFPVLVDVTTICDERKRPTARVAYSLDLTERKQAEARLRQSEAQYRLLAENGSDVVWMLELASQRFTYVSPSVEQLRGYTVAEVLRQTIAEVMSPESYQMFEKTMPIRLAAFAAGDDSVRSQTHEIWQRHRDGSAVPTEVVTTLIADARRQVTHIQGATRSITERKQAEERSRRLRDLGFVVAASADLPTALRLCLDTAILISGMDAGGIYLAEKPSGDLRLECHSGLSADFIAAVSSHSSDSENARWARKNQPFHGHARSQDRLVPTVEMREGLQALSIIPLYHDGQLVGVLNVTSHTVAEVPPAARDALETVASLVGGLIQRMRAQQALQESELRLSTALRGANMGVWDWNIEIDKTVWSGNHEALWGYLPGEFPGTREAFLSRVHPEDIAGMELEGKRAIQDGSIFRHECRVVWPDGSVHWVCSHGQPIYDDKGKAVRMVGVAFDITERKSTELSLNRLNVELEQRVRERTAEALELYHHAPCGYHSLGPDGVVLQMNDTELGWLGYSRDEVMGRRRLADLMMPASAALFEKHFLECRGQLAPVTVEWDMRCKDGSTITLLVNAEVVQDEAGRFHHIRSTVMNITERKRVEEALRDSELKYRLLFDSAGDAIFVHDAAGRILAANLLGQAQLGYTLEELLSMTVSQVDSPQVRQQVPQRMAKLLEQGHLTFETAHQRKDGSVFPLEASAQRIVWEGKPAILSITRDLTERRRIDEELRQAKEAADSANRAKSAFLANMSHEIRTPMNAILGFAQLMQRDPALTEQQRQWLDTINHSGEHLIRLISDILDMAKIESGRVPLAQEEFDFPSLLEAMEAMFRLRLEEKGLYFEIQHAANIPRHVVSDVGKIRQVLTNLLGNAIKFTEQGGIRLRVTAEPAPPTASGQSTVRLCLEVADTGHGITPEDLDRVFEAFEQARNRRSSGGGTGLGLAISRRLAQMLGGELTATSEAGVGSTFRFTFVAAVQAAASGAATAAARAGRVIGLRTGGPPPVVLVVDDTESNRAVLRDLLEMVGFVAREANDGAAAVALCQAERPALVLMDRWMPVLDGLAATRMIRDGLGGRDTRILIVSADAIGTSEEVWRTAGADGFISKPFRNDELLAEIGTLLNLNYVYAEPSAPPALARPVLELSAIAQLPAGLRADIIRATEAGDGARLRELIVQGVSPLQPALGQALGQLAAGYDYRALLRALKEKEL